MDRHEEILTAYGIWCAVNGIDSDEMLQPFEAGVYVSDLFPKNKWRSVKDELPETNDDVLADVLVAYGDKIYHEYELAYFNQDKRQWLTLDGEPIKVAHWQPLPELPKTEE